MTTPKDQRLYDTIKNEIIIKYKPSAYRSGLIVRKYKKAYLEKYGNNNAYYGNKENSNLQRWFKEKWVNQRGAVGYSAPYDIYRPSIKVNRKTPKTYAELTSADLTRAMREKQATGRVKRF